MSKFVTSFLKDESGASAAEYVLILALVGLAIVVGATALGTSLSNKMSTVGGQITAAGTTPAGQ